MTINHTRTMLYKSYKYKPGGCGFDSRMRHWYFLLTYYFRSHYDPAFDSVSKKNEYKEYFLGSSGGGVLSSDNLTIFMCRLS